MKQRPFATIPTFAAAAAFALAIAATPAYAAKNTGSSGAAVAVVNGVSIPASFAKAMMEAQNVRGKEKSPDLEQAIREELIRRQILVQQASAKGLDKRSDVSSQMELARQGVLVGAYISDFLKATPISDASLKNEYDTITKTTGDKEYKLSHILLDSENDAKSLISQLKASPTKFADLAKQHSKDTETKEKGGDLGWAPPTIYVKPFADALAGLSKGKFTETAVKSQFGYHIIMLDDTREIKPPPFDEVKGQLLQRMQARLVEKHIADLRAKASIK